MFLLYADESGTHNSKHFILAGVSMFERKAYHVQKDLDEIARRFLWGGREDIELHGSNMLGGKNAWRKISKDDRIKAIKDALRLIDGKDLRIFASVVKKSALPQGDDLLHHSFEQLISRFDYFLTREHFQFNNTQRGLVVFDKTKAEDKIQSMTHSFRNLGHKWADLKNIAEVPVFIHSTATRLIQLADLVAYALSHKYELDDSQFFDIIEQKFDSFGGKQHGLYTCL